MQHRIGFLWRFHAIHHSAELMDWLAAHREHPLDTLWTMTLINLPGALLGFDIKALAGFLAFRAVWSIYLHFNVRLPIGPLRILIGSPELHHWHHDRSRDSGNYANLTPFLDVLFGTYCCPPHEPDAFGITEPMPGHFAGLLIRPFVPQRATRPAVCTSSPTQRPSFLAAKMQPGRDRNCPAAAKRMTGRPVSH